MQHRRRGFTLVELLVVIGIIMVLIAILIPVVGKSRDSARTAQCMSNQRQIFVAMKAFAGDNNDLVPGTCGGFPSTGPPAASAAQAAGTVTKTGVTIGQAIGANEMYSQSVIEQSTKSALVVRGYLGSTAVFHCPERDAHPYIYGVATPSVVFHYVFNQYFVGDSPCDPSTFLPVWTASAPVPAGPFALLTNSSSSFSQTFTTRLPVNYTRSKNPQQCVMITEDQAVNAFGNVTDSEAEFTPPLATAPPPAKSGAQYQPFDRIHCARVHNKRGNKKDDFFRTTFYSNVICTYLDGHGENVYVATGDPNAVDPVTGLQQNFSVESDTAGLRP